MTNVERELIFRVVDGDHRLFITMSHWYQKPEYMGVLCWCVENKITGKNLFEWLKLWPHIGHESGYIFILDHLKKNNRVYNIGYRGKNP